MSSAPRPSSHTDLVVVGKSAENLQDLAGSVGHRLGSRHHPGVAIVR